MASIAKWTQHRNRHDSARTRRCLCRCRILEDRTARHTVRHLSCTIRIAVRIRHRRAIGTETKDDNSEEEDPIFFVTIDFPNFVAVKAIDIVYIEYGKLVASNSQMVYIGVR